MTKHNAANERIKREYFGYLKRGDGPRRSDDRRRRQVARAVRGIDQARDFKRFHREQAVAFKRGWRKAVNARTGERLSKATMLSTLRDLRAFFFWLAHLPGFKSHIAYADADYFNLSDKDVAVARARREKRVPTLEQVQHVLSAMPADTVLERRDRALIAFATLTGARVGGAGVVPAGARRSRRGYVEQDARTVRTKFAKTFRTYFMPIGGDALAIFADWIARAGARSPLGPRRSAVPGNANGPGRQRRLPRRRHLAERLEHDAADQRDIPPGFEAAGLPYFNPHSFRDMLVRHAMTLDLSPEAMKAWSQNLGHADVLTTFTSYGSVPAHRQGELIRAAGKPQPANDVLDDPNVRALIAAIQRNA